MSTRLAFSLCALALGIGCAPATVSSPPVGDASATDVGALDVQVPSDRATSDVPTPPSDGASGDDVASPTDAATAPDVVLAEDAQAPSDAPAIPDSASSPDAAAPADAPVVRCAQDSQCAAPLAVCDRLRGQCAQCSTASPCASGQVCASGRCVAAVACSSSRMCPGQVCDAEAGRCVDCVGDPDCPTSERCRLNQCVPAPRSCRSSRECSDLNQVCHPTDGVCVDCAGDNDCSEGFCRSDSTCSPRVCTPNARTCASVTAVRVCDARGASTSDTSCASDQVCSAGQCRSRVCAPGAADCDSNGARRVCNSDGLGYTTSACPAMLVCAGGVCAEGCAGGLLRCGGACVDARSDVMNCGGCGVRCASGEVCAQGRTGCVAACVPATAATAVAGTSLIARLPGSIATRPSATSGNGRGLVGEESATAIAFLLGRTAPLTNADLEEAVTRVEVPVSENAPPRSLLAGQRFTLADGSAAINERIAVSCTSATALRDRIANALGMPGTGSATLVGADISCVVELAVTRTSGRDIYVSIAVTSRTAFDTSDATARRLRDIAVFGLPQSTAATAAVCASLRAEAMPPVDVLWLQDTSASLSPHQARVGRGADAFLRRFAALGLDARVAVIAAGSTAQNYDNPGLTWVTPTQGSAAFALCDRLTTSSLGPCPLSGSDTTGPYPNTSASTGANEEPVAASVINTTALIERAVRGETNVDRRIRAGARVVTVGLTDESGSNDFSRYFDQTSAPDTRIPWGSSYSPTVVTNIAAWFTRNRVLHLGFYPHRLVRCGADVSDLHRCVASAAGGAYANLTNATDADTQSSMTAFVDALAASITSVRLPAVPVSGVARVVVRGVEVPRSRVDGYDLDPVHRAVLFYGARYRPAAGESVSVTFPAY